MRGGGGGSVPKESDTYLYWWRAGTQLKARSSPIYHSNGWMVVNPLNINVPLMSSLFQSRKKVLKMHLNFDFF